MGTGRGSSVSDDGETEGSNKTKRAKTTEGGGDVVVSHSHSLYEQIREQRIKENMERMQKLGLLDLSLNLKKNNPHGHTIPKKKTTIHDDTSPPEPQRRSSRIMSLEPVNYSYRVPKAQNHSLSSKEKKEREVEICIAEGTNPEVYTEAQEKLLGDCESAWELYVDGYDEDGIRINDPTKGEKCHQCGHITLCQLTDCNKCELPQGRVCGDCLYTRYGENVIEANSNPKWTCPACRGICNCNSCRKKNGWMSTGNIYSKVTKLGFKSVAHYLTKTYRPEKCMEGSETPTDTTMNRSIRTRRALRSL